MMRLQKYILVLWCMAMLVACKQDREVYMFTSFHEPATEGLRFLYSYDGYHWEALEGIFLQPEVGTQKVMRDPSIAVGKDGVFHLVWTSSWRGDKGFGYANSEDLINWSKQKLINVMEHEPTTVNVWAPELFYDDEKDEFIILWASTIPHRFEKGIEAEDNNHRMYYTTTKDFVTFSDTKLFFDPGYSTIDSEIVKIDKDNYVQVLKDNTRPERNLKVAFADNPLGPFRNISPPFTGNFTEGPSTIKVGDDWLIYYDDYEEKRYGAMKTRDFKTFTDITDVVKVPEGHKHGTIFKAKESVLEGLKKEIKRRKNLSVRTLKED